MTDRTFCDGPGCEQTQPTVQEDSDTHWSWIQVETGDDVDCGDFCSWTCLAAWSVNKAIQVEGVMHVPTTSPEEDK